MQKNWDSESRRVIRADGTRLSVPYLLSTEQVDRWSAAGFDISAAAERVATFNLSFKETGTAKEAALALRDFFRSEADRAQGEGVSDWDVHFGRIAASASSYVWTRPLAKTS